LEAADTAYTSFAFVGCAGEKMALSAFMILKGDIGFEK
jgi:hypothetical protein